MLHPKAILLNNSFNLHSCIHSCKQNVCLGLANKKEIVSEIIKVNKIDICCLQEIDIQHNFNHEVLSFKGYNLLIEKNEVKSQIGMYIPFFIKLLISKITSQNDKY